VLCSGLANKYVTTETENVLARVRGVCFAPDDGCDAMPSMQRSVGCWTIIFWSGPWLHSQARIVSQISGSQCARGFRVALQAPKIHQF
jgi:hypothetical protein